MGERNASRVRVGKIASKTDRTKVNSRKVKVRKHKEMNLSSKQQVGLGSNVAAIEYSAPVIDNNENLLDLNTCFSNLTSLLSSVAVLSLVSTVFAKGKMQPLSHLVRVSLPNYLAGLPIPDSFGGWFRLGVKDWLALVPFTAAVAGLSYMSYRAFCPAFLRKRPINPIIRKDSKKVVDFIEIEDISEKVSLCRCWLSKKWPYCDGAHGPHNRQTGDNVGPVVVRHKPAPEK